MSRASQAHDHSGRPRAVAVFGTARMIRNFSATASGFPGGIGNTWGDAATFDTLYTDVVARVFDVYSDETWVYPGHGNDTTLGSERPHLDEGRARGW